MASPLAVRALRRAMRVRALQPLFARATRRGLIPRSVWRGVPHRGRFRVDLGGGRSVSFQSAAGETVPRFVYWGGPAGFEPETVPVFLGLVAEARGFLDVGADIGLYTLYGLAWNSGLRAVAFEPRPEAAAAARANLSLNHFQARAEVVESAVAERPGRASLHVPLRPDEASSASLDPDGYRGVRGRLREVPVVSLDSWWDGSFPVDLVKVDVEGFEHLVLDGMTAILSEASPTLIMECNSGDPEEECDRVLSAHGYSVALLTDSGPVAVPAIAEAPSLETPRSFLCRPG